MVTEQQVIECLTCSDAYSYLRCAHYGESFVLLDYYEKLGFYGLYVNSMYSPAKFNDEDEAFAAFHEAEKRLLSTPDTEGETA